VEAVGGAEDAGGAAVEDVGVDHGGGDVAVAEELLDGADVGAVLQQVGGEGVAEGVAGGWPSRTARCSTDSCRWWRRRWPDSRCR
jgi:hypothetical protein